MMDDSKILDLLEQANLHMRRNETEEGKRLYQEIIDSGTTPALRLRNLGLIYQSQALYEKAIDKYKEALRLDEGCCSVHLRLGEIYAIMKRFDEAILHYKRSLDSNSYNEVSQACDFCGGTKNEIVTVRNLKLSCLNTYGAINPIKIWVKCSKCGLVYTDPRPSEESLKRFYEAQPQSDEEGIQKRYIHRLSFLIKLCAERLEVIEKYSPKGRLLDIGAAIGVFVGTAQEFGWEAKGLELSEFSCQYGRDKLGVDLVNANFEEYEDDEGFEAITMWALIEHLNSPLKGLEKVNVLLKAGGVLAILTPNLSGLYSRVAGFRYNYFWDTPEHLYFFSREILYKYLERCGFEILEYRISTQGEGRMEIYARKVREWIR